MPIRLVLGCALVAVCAWASACGEGSQPTAPAPSAPPTRVESVTDGDTIRISPPTSGASAVRFLNIDAPELSVGTQEPWASESRDALRGLLPVNSAVTLTTEREVQDSFGRALAHVTRTSDGLNVNREQVRAGHAALYVLWPNAAQFIEYRTAQIAAQDRGLGIWNPTRGLTELPFESRLRTGNRPPSQPVGDFFTRFYVDARSYPLVHVNNRVFFSNDAEAQGAGFTLCPQQGSRYADDCFGSGR
ncbi:MAG: thermonuclease family protein [Acidobacteria bacterium]|nr:thermonuclease family protein [Acidobacteriota bacterium]